MNCLLSASPSVHTSSKTYSNTPPPGIGRDLVRPSSLIIEIIVSWTVHVRERKTFHRKPSCISGTRRNVRRGERAAWSDTRRRAGVCRCEVRAKAEKCRDADRSFAVFMSGSTAAFGRTRPGCDYIVAEWVRTRITHHLQVLPARVLPTDDQMAHSGFVGSPKGRVVGLREYHAGLHRAH